MRTTLSLSALLLVPAASRAAPCDGTELICIDLSSRAEVEASGGTVVGGNFEDGGFRPTNKGGIDWEFGPEVDLSVGRMEVDVTGLLPVAGGELEGGKVSIFSALGRGGDDNHTLGLQKMDEEYRGGHIFRYGLDDDGLADNWDAVIITGSGFSCGEYSIRNWTVTCGASAAPVTGSTLSRPVSTWMRS